jgi:signal transduction histidine kinase
MDRAAELDAVNRELYARNAELAVRNKTLSLLRKIDEVTMTALETGDMTRGIAVILAKEFFYPFVAIALHNPHRHALEWTSVACKDKRAGFCEPGIIWNPIRLSSSTNACVRAFRKRTRVISSSLTDVLGKSISDDELALVKNSGNIHSVITFPLSSDQEKIGVLVIGLDRPANKLSRHEKDTFEPLLNLVTIAIEKAQIYSSLMDTTDKLRSANKKLKELDSLKTEFLSIASHQLRSPLAVMKGYMEMLGSGMLGKMSKKQTDALTTVRTSTEQLILLVNHLLDLTRIESGRLQVRLEPMDVAQTVEWVVKFMNPRAKEKGVELILTTVGTPKVQADPDKLKEVVMNLIDNALKYTEKGSVAVRIKKDQEFVSIEVKDTGYGLTSADKHRLFEKFSTGSASKFVKTTSGLGLYVCRKLVEAMKGTITADSKGAGKGSTFTVRLPVAV